MASELMPEQQTHFNKHQLLWNSCKFLFNVALDPGYFSINLKKRDL
jgi:hypothetical protein